MKEIIKKNIPSLYQWFRNYRDKFMGQIAPKTRANILYKNSHGHPLNWNNPQDVDEKINWLKFNSDTSRWVELADKYRVRKYVEECGLGNMLVKLYGKWDKAKDINWDDLPQQFVMKVNNGSGDILVCRDKSKLDYGHWTQYFSQLLRTRFGYNMGETHYAKIKPCIIAEELLDNTAQTIKSSSLVDYKIWSFNGEPAYIWVCYDRTPHSCVVKIYDLDWQAHPEYSVDCEHYQLSKIDIPRPQSLDQMLAAAAKLSKGFPAVRVDLYEVNNKPFFGEMTFTPAAGYNYFYTEEFLKILGNKVTINHQ